MSACDNIDLSLRPGWEELPIERLNDIFQFLEGVEYGIVIAGGKDSEAHKMLRNYLDQVYKVVEGRLGGIRLRALHINFY